MGVLESSPGDRKERVSKQVACALVVSRQKARVKGGTRDARREKGTSSIIQLLCVRLSVKKFQIPFYTQKSETTL